jgi:transcriptional regulator with PAS, ATPase and Fis domain
MASVRHGFDRASRVLASMLERDLLAAELARTCPRPAGDLATGAPPRRPDGVLTPGELGLRYDDVYRLAIPVLEASAAKLAPSAHALAFFDAGGWMLWLGGDAGIAERLAALDFRPGTRWYGDASAAGLVATASADRRALELVVSDGVVTSPQSWRCSWAPVLGRPAGEWLGSVHVTGRGELDELAAAGAIADAVEDRVRSARAVRQQVIEFALRSSPADAMFAVDSSGRLVAVTAEARRHLPLEGGDLPGSVREDLRAALEQASPAAPPELFLDGPAASRVRLVASPVRYEQHAIGGIVRVVGARAPARPEAAPAGAPVARYAFEQIRGDSEAIRAALALARTAARNELPVVLRGESGSGKELFAQAIHSASSRGGGPFVPMNCGCIPADLLEAELFGYEPGTFTGGRREGNAGKFEKAAKGTIFLDEVTELSPRAQTALLRVLQEREVVRLGGSSPRRIDVRVIAAANADLTDAVRSGSFRNDLYYRLNVLPIAVPALRERRHDIGLLARAFLREAEAEVGRSGLSLSDDAIASLEAYPWPGNVRELRNIVLRSAATAETSVIRLADLPREVRAGRAGAPGSRTPAIPALARSEGGAPDREALLGALDASAWNVARTAQLLKVSRMTLYRWLRKLHIDR